MGATGALLLGASTSAAQRIRSSLDVGAASLRYADSLSLSALTVTPDLHVDWERAIAELTATFSRFGGGGWSTQGAASGSLFTTARRGLLGELAGNAGGSAHEDRTRTGQAIVNIRLHGMNQRAGGFAGLGGGGTWDGTTWRRLLLGELGGWIQHSSGLAQLTITPVAVDDSIRYLDGQLTLSRSFQAFDISAIAGGRGGGQNPGVATRARSWGSLSATAWVSPRLAIVAGAGTYPVDPTQGFPGGRYLSFSARIATSNRRIAILPARDSAPVAGAVLEPVSAIEEFAAIREVSGSVSIRLKVPAARLVEITGDFSGWTPIRLEAAQEGWWATRLRLRPGRYEMNVRVDGGAWLVPPGVLALRDEFGGSTGLLLIDGTK